MEKLEQKIEQLQTEVSSADFFNLPPEKSAPVYEKLSKLEAELETALERREELESMV